MFVDWGAVDQVSVSHIGRRFMTGVLSNFKCWTVVAVDGGSSQIGNDTICLYEC